MPALTLTCLKGNYPVFAAFKLPFRTVRHRSHCESRDLTAAFGSSCHPKANP